MTSGAPVLRRSVLRGRLGLLGCSSWFLGVLDAEVDDAGDDSWRGSFAVCHTRFLCKTKYSSYA
jgi:hypothetical protein